VTDTDPNKLHEQLEELRELIDSVNDIIYSHDLQGRFISVNRAGTELLGYNEQDILAMNVADVVDPDYLLLAREKIREKAIGVKHHSPPYELLCRAREGREVWLEVSTRIAGERIIGIGRDVSERHEYAQKLRELSIRDPLTGLHNQSYFWEALEKEAAKVDRYGREMSLIVMDIDDLAQFNDRYGHSMGDDVIKAVAVLIQDEIRNVDYGCRYSGEEFGVILPETGTERARQVADRLREKFAAVRFEILGINTSKTVSQGLAQYVPGEGSEDLFRRASRALYAAKGDGGNVLSVHEN